MYTTATPWFCILPAGPHIEIKLTDGLLVRQKFSWASKASCCSWFMFCRHTCGSICLQRLGSLKKNLSKRHQSQVVKCHRGEAKTLSLPCNSSALLLFICFPSPPASPSCAVPSPLSPPSRRYHRPKGICSAHHPCIM